MIKICEREKGEIEVWGKKSKFSEEADASERIQKMKPLTFSFDLRIQC